MPENTDFLKDYVQVKDRVKELFELFGQARIETTYEITREPDDRPKVIARALIYRNPEDTAPASVGTSWLYLPGTTNFTKGSEIENAETSAVGRAIGFLGILTEKSLASANEIAGHADPTEPSAPKVDGLIGTAEKGTTMTTDWLVRQSPDGPFLGLRLKDGSPSGFICEARGVVAQALAAFEEGIVGQRVQCWGSWHEYEPPVVKHKYRAYRLDRIATPMGTFPDDALPVEAPSLPLGRVPEAEAELDGLVSA